MAMHARARTRVCLSVCNGVRRCGPVWHAFALTHTHARTHTHWWWVVVGAGKEHPDTLVAGCNLAGMRRAQGKLAEAAALGEEVLAAARRVQGNEHPDTLNAGNDLALTYRDQGEHAQAVALQQEVYVVTKRVREPLLK